MEHLDPDTRARLVASGADLIMRADDVIKAYDKLCNNPGLGSPQYIAELFAELYAACHNLKQARKGLLG